MRIALLMMLIALVGTGIVCYFTLPFVELVADERAAPGWVYVERDPNCPPTTRGLVTTLPVDETGFGCTSSEWPKGLLGLSRPGRIRIIDRETGRQKPYPGRLALGDGREIWSVEQDCMESDIPVRKFYSTFLGTSEDLAKASTQYDKKKELGLTCAQMRDAQRGKEEGQEQ